MVKNFQFGVFLSQVYFDMQNSNPMSIFVGRDRKTSIIRMNIFPDWEYDTAVEFLCDRLRWDSLRIFVASLRPTVLAIGAVALPNFRFGPEKLLNSTLFAVERNNTLMIKFESFD